MPRKRLDHRKRRFDQQRRRHAQRVSHPAPREKSSLKSLAAVAAQVAADDQLCRKLGKSHRAIETSRGERRHRACRVSNEQTAIVADSPENAIDRNEAAAAFDRAAADNVLHAPPKLGERFRWIEAFAITGDADVSRPAIRSDPRDVSRREPRIDKAVQRRSSRRRFHDFLETDQKLRISIEPQLTSHDRARAVSADDEPCCVGLAPILARDDNAAWLAGNQRR